MKRGIDSIKLDCKQSKRFKKSINSQDNFDDNQELANQNLVTQCGPRAKSIHTKILEMVVKSLIRNSDEIITIKSGDEIYLSINKIMLSLSSLLEKVDFEHISLNEEDSDFCLEFFKQTKKNRLAYEGLLTEFEEDAIQSYSIGAYKNINDLLYRNLSVLDENSIQTALLQATFLASGLNKLPPVYIHAKTKYDRRCYHGDGNVSIESIDQREKSISLSQSTKHSAFLSCTKFLCYTPKFRKSKELHKSILVKFDVNAGKSISALNFYCGEEESITLPCDIRWASKKEKMLGKNRDESATIYKGKVTRELTAPNVPTHEEIAVKNFLKRKLK